MPSSFRYFRQAVKEVQATFAPYRVEGVSVVDELIRERREEARRESHDKRNPK